MKREAGEKIFEKKNNGVKGYLEKELEKKGCHPKEIFERAVKIGENQISRGFLEKPDYLLSVAYPNEIEALKKGDPRLYSLLEREFRTHYKELYQKALKRKKIF